MKNIERIKEDLIKLQVQEMEFNEIRTSFNFNVKRLGMDRHYCNDIDNYLDAKLFICNYSIIDKLFNPKCPIKEKQEILDTIKKDGLTLEEIMDRFLIYDRCGIQEVIEKEQELLKESKRINNIMFPTTPRKVIDNCLDVKESIRENISEIIKTNINKGSKKLVKSLDKVVKFTE